MIYLAKSDGTSLRNHSIMVADVAVEILRNSVDEYEYKKYENIVRISALLHDIGKATTIFQNFLLNDKDKNIDYIHNQYGAAFLFYHLKISDDIKNHILDSVYWHHGISKSVDSYYDIYKYLSDVDKNMMKNYIKDILGDDFLLDDINDDIYNITPKYFITEDRERIKKNIDNILIRSCVIGGDRIVSKFSKEELNEINIKEEVITSLKRNDIVHELRTNYDGTERFNNQLSIVDEVGKTTIINAPAGFGKTVIGLLWGLKRNNKKIIWVCPRNIVAESVYNSILNELSEFNLSNVSVELYLNSEVKKYNINIENIQEGFYSDIIVTNIDNFLYTSTNNNRLNTLYLTNNVNVVFDEYHEYITSNALMSLFILIMNLRHNKLNSETLLLSATYVPINYLWEGGLNSNPTKILPTKNKHYNAVHDKKYLLNVVNDRNDIVDDNNVLTIFNSISKSQKEKHDKNYKYLIHSKFERDERDKQFSTLIKLYGKYSERNINKSNIVGTHIIQASLDISFKYLYESVLSPQSTLQRIGRCDRWGDYDGMCIINIFRENDKSEKSSIEYLYNEKLNDMWWNFISSQNGNYLTLNEIYDMYNQFNIKYEKVIRNGYINNKYNESFKNLSDLYPVKYFNKKGDVMTAGSNKLRSSGNEIFVIYKKIDDDSYTEPFSEEVEDIEKQFKENGKTFDIMKRDMERMKDDNRYEYGNLKRVNRIGVLRDNAKKSNKPYIRYDCIYDSEYGIIKEELYHEFKK